MKTTHEYKRLYNNNQLTEQGSLTVEVYVQDTYSGRITGTKTIKRAELARLFYEQRVTGSKDNKFVVGY